MRRGPMIGAGRLRVRAQSIARALAPALLLQGPVVVAQPAAGGATDTLEEVLIEGRRETLLGEARSASEGSAGQMELALRPMLRPGDVLEAVPGMIVTQHSGSGKSNQMFLRGFNLDHGTDFSTTIDGMPVNMRTHGHGQGYTDINFLIPETIRTLDYVKGPYHAERGDFSSAGGVDITTFRRMPASLLKLGVGENGFGRLLALGGSDLQTLHLAGALEAQRYAGPWASVDEDVDKVNGLLTLSGEGENADWHVTAMAYRNRWNSADQIPERAVSRGLIGELGSLDTSLGGDSHRVSLSGEYAWDTANGETRLRAYLIDYQMQLWSNFTYRLEDPAAGDQFEQFDDRRIWGASWNRGWSGGDREQFRHRVGGTVRYDDIGRVGLYATQQRKRRGTVREDRVDETSAGLFYELAWQLADDWRLVAGLRGDVYRFEVDAGNPLNAGNERDTIVSPKASLIHSLSDQTELYLSAGRGFHSNDARGTTIRVDPVSGEAVEAVDPLVASQGAEVGFKSVWLDSWNTSLALWYLELDSELLFVGDAGSTEASRASRRWGLEFNNFWVLNDIWSLEADVAWTDARFADSAPEGSEIPGALPFVLSGALSARYPQGWFGSLRLRHFADYPLIEDDSVQSEGATIVNLALGWSSERWSLQLDALNLLDSNDHDIDYFYRSRLPGESLAGVEDVHFKVFEPRQLRMHLSLNF